MIWETKLNTNLQTMINDMYSKLIEKYWEMDSGKNVTKLCYKSILCINTIINLLDISLRDLKELTATSLRPKTKGFGVCIRIKTITYNIDRNICSDLSWL